MLAILLVLQFSSVDAAPLFYTNRAAFEAAGGAAVVEDFNDANVPPFVICTATGPLDSTSSNACIGSGDIAPGVSFIDVPAAPSGLAFLGAGATAGATSTVFGPDAFAAGLEATFASGVRSVGFDFFGNSSAPILISVMGSSGLLGLVGTTIDPSTRFFGVTLMPGDAPIVSIVTSSPSGELIDNLAFGGVRIAIAEPPTSLLLAIALVGVASPLLRRRRG
ncbi:MAG TPA: hypothetical protein VNG69_00085 [Casimicrobiaceae bacterium]|nr:hypothetical protein [Casimicrobiaceae bacterium]